MRQVEEKVNKSPGRWIGLMSLIFTILISILGFFGAYIFNEVAAAPKTYETIDLHNRDVDRIQEQMTRIEDKIDDGFKEVREILIK